MKARPERFATLRPWEGRWLVVVMDAGRQDLTKPPPEPEVLFDLTEVRGVVRQMSHVDSVGRHIAEGAGYTYVPFGACFDCGDVGCTNTYMLNDDVWFEAWVSWVGALCLYCVESRIGRKLTIDDFTEYPINGTVRWAWERGSER